MEREKIEKEIKSSLKAVAECMDCDFESVTEVIIRNMETIDMAINYMNLKADRHEKLTMHRVIRELR
jgi:hypothetical protein